MLKNKVLCGLLFSLLMVGSSFGDKYAADMHENEKVTPKYSITLLRPSAWDNDIRWIHVSHLRFLDNGFVEFTRLDGSHVIIHGDVLIGEEKPE